MDPWSYKNATLSGLFNYQTSSLDEFKFLMHSQIEVMLRQFFLYSTHWIHRVVCTYYEDRINIIFILPAIPCDGI